MDLSKELYITQNEGFGFNLLRAMVKALLQRNKISWVYFFNVEVLKGEALKGEWQLQVSITKEMLSSLLQVHSSQQDQVHSSPQYQGISFLLAQA